MTLYSYRALSAAGKAERGTLQAASESDARADLRDRGLYPLDLRTSKTMALNWSRLLRFGRSPSLSVQQLAVFTRQLATLLQATIPYDTALGLILQESSDLDFKSMLSDVRGRVVEGAYLADALGSYPGYFPPMVMNMIRAGETSGTLVAVLQRLADYYDNVGRLRTKIAAALVYPIFMTFFGLTVVIFMVTFIIPRISRLFDSFGAQLPLPTRILIATSNIVTGYWWLLIILVGSAIYGANRYLKTEKGQLMRDTAELSIPLLRGFRRKVILQRFTQTLATLLKSGVELKTALAVATEVMENRLYLQAMDHVIFDVQNKGLPFSVALRRVSGFPEDLCQMVAIGEETATLDSMLETVANRLSQEVAATLDAATALFEPVLILAMGAVVGFIVVSVLLPLLQLNQLVH
ncbi:MAG TPA: type II secretion system F family protein [bacterium]